MSELKPCPKCSQNGAPLRRIGKMDEYMVECVECYTVRTPWFKTILEAEVYWNAFAEGMKQQAARIAELEKFIKGILATMQESTGIVGYHLNGDIATWDELGLIEEATELLEGTGNNGNE